MTAIKYAFLGLMALLAFGLAACGSNGSVNVERTTLGHGLDDITKSVLEDPAALRTALSNPALKESLILKVTQDLS